MSSRAIPRHLVVALALVPLLWLGTRWARFTTTMEVETTPTGVRATIEGQSLEWPVAGANLRGITVVGTQHFFRSGGETMTIQSGDGMVTHRIPLPRRFDFPPGRWLVSDWWVDYNPREASWALPPVNVPPPWRLRATFHGRGQAALKLEGDGVVLATVGFRAGSYDNDLYLLDGAGRPVAAQALNAKFSRDIRTALELPLNAALLAALLVAGFHFLSLVGRHARERRWPRVASGWIIPVLAGELVLVLWVAGWVLDARPHFQDDLGYLLRAKWLLAGHLTLPKPAQVEHFDIPFTLVVGDRWLSQYPIGWPALLALGETLNSAWIVAPLCAFIAAFTTWRIGREFWGNTVGFAGTLLLVLSPLASILSGSMLSHAATTMWLSLFLLHFLRGWRGEGRPRDLLLAGLFLGFAFSGRPLSGVAVGAVSGIFVLAELKRRRLAAPAWRLLGVLVLGGILGALPALFDNWMVTGRPFTFAYNLNYPTVWSASSYEIGTFWVDRTLALFSTLAFGWGWPWLASQWLFLTLPFAIALVPFLRGQASRADWLLFGMVTVFPVAFAGYNYGGLHGFGPRYYVDTLFALALLVARGFRELAQSGASDRRSPWPRVVAVGIFIFVTGLGAATLVPRLNLYRGYNSVDDRIERRLAEQSITRGLILLEPPAYLNWVRAARLLSPDLGANLVFAEKRSDNSALLRAYEGWPVYVVDDDRIRPYAPR